MHGYLVLLRHTMDDLPLGLFETREQALSYANTIGGMPGDWDRDILQTDCSMPVCVAIVTFKDCYVSEMEIVREFGDDEGDDESPEPAEPPQPAAGV